MSYSPVNNARLASNAGSITLNYTYLNIVEIFNKLFKKMNIIEIGNLIVTSTRKKGYFKLTGKISKLTLFGPFSCIKWYRLYRILWQYLYCFYRPLKNRLPLSVKNDTVHLSTSAVVCSLLMCFNTAQKVSFFVSESMLLQIVLYISLVEYDLFVSNKYHQKMVT